MCYKIYIIELLKQVIYSKIEYVIKHVLFHDA